MKVSRATLRIVPCATVAKIALRSSPNTVENSRARPSDSQNHIARILTSRDRRSCKNPYGRLVGDRHIHAIDDRLEQERHLNIQDFASNQQGDSRDDTYLDPIIALRPDVGSQLPQNSQVGPELLLCWDCFGRNVGIQRL